MEQSIYFTIGISIGAAIGTIVTRLYLSLRSKSKVHISGRLVIDKTGEKDRWTIFFDDDLGDVEKMDKVVLHIERIE